MSVNVNNLKKNLTCVMAAVFLTTVPLEATTIRMDVQAELSEIQFGSSIVRNLVTGATERRSGARYTNPSSGFYSENNFTWGDIVQQSGGSMLVDYDPTGGSAPTFSDCTGVLQLMCLGANGYMSMEGGNSFSSWTQSDLLTTLGSESLTYTEHRLHNWRTGDWLWRSLTPGVRISFDITSSSISPVPLSSSLAFLLAGLGMLFGARRLSARKA